MAKDLVIVESPAKAKTISKYLGDNFIIKASMGHVRDLPTYYMGVNINKNFLPTYQNLKDKAKLLKELKEIADKCKTVWIATDPDREGEAIAWHIQHACELADKKVKRIVFHEITKTAIQGAIKQPRKINMQLVDAQQARRILDRLIGYKLSPFLSKKIRKGLSAGRVQSVAVKIIVDRERAILAFVPEEYWPIEATMTKDDQKIPFQARLFAINTESNKLEITNGTDAERILGELKQAQYKVSSVKKTAVTRQPAPPFITSTLQQEASRKLNWAAKKTMLIAQQLYEGIQLADEHTGLITYMRTDSFRISDEAKVAAKDFITQKYGANYLPPKERVFKQKKMAQDAHEAIRPTYVDKTPEKLSSQLTSDHLKLYKLIWDRFLASQMASLEQESTQVNIAAPSAKQTYLLRASGSVVLFDGFSRVYSEGKDEAEPSEEDAKLPKLTEKDELNLKEIKTTQKFTQPPSRYTEATLVKEMEENGIGRPSTYAPTLSTVQDRGYVLKEKKHLLPTELGMLVTSRLEEFFQKIIDVTFTAQLETHLDEIMEGKHAWPQVVREYYEPLAAMLIHADKEMVKINQDRPTDELCPKCAAPMVIKNGRFGDFIACSLYPECKTTKAILIEIEMPCPKCSGKILEKRSKKGMVFYGCGSYPKCNFAAWGKPVLQKCLKCESPYQIQKKGKGGKEYIYCSVCADAKKQATEQNTKTVTSTKKTKAKSTAKKSTAKAKPATKKSTVKAKPVTAKKAPVKPRAGSKAKTTAPIKPTTKKTAKAKPKLKAKK